MTDDATDNRCCDYCELPLPSGWSTSAADGPEYCCFGCRFAAAVTREQGAEGALRWTLTRLGIAIFFTMNVMVFSMTLWTQDLYEVDPSQPLAGSFRELLRYLCLIFSLPVLFLLGRPLLDNALEQLRRGRLSSDLLLVAGVLAAFLFSMLSLIRSAPHVYFEVGCMVLVMVTLGRWLEAVGRQKASDALDELQQLLPATARCVSDTGETVERPREEIRVGQVIRVVSGERVPLDGSVLSGVASLDEQVLTGEALPVEKAPGDTLWAGTLNLDGSVDLRVDAAANSGAFVRLMELMRDARLSQGRYHRLADRVSQWFFPVVTAIAAVTFGVHWWQSGIAAGIMASMSVVLIACPCALGLATPLAVWTALGNAARRHVLFRSGETVERMAGVRVVCFDKTGTLTTGKLKVQRLILAGCAEAAIAEDAVAELALVGQLVPHSSHPVARALSTYVADNRAPTESVTLRVDSVRERPGLGLLGLAGTETVCLGNERLLKEQEIEIDPTLRRQLEVEAAAGHAISWLAQGGRAVAGFVLEEQLRPDAREVVTELHQLGLQLLVLSGDQRTRVATLASELEIEFQAELLPDDKLAMIRRLQREAGPVMMVGDGINDAPALAASDVGVAMGCGTDLSRDAAGVCLLTNELQRLVWATQLARRTTRVVRQNLVWAFAYNSAGIAVAACGLLNPIVAAVVMIVSSGLVIGNSLRLAEATRSEATVTADILLDRSQRKLSDESQDRTSPVLVEAVR